MATPLRPPDRTRPLLDLTSGYITRGAHLFPVQGEHGPWRVRQNPVLDRLLLVRADVTEQISVTGADQPKRTTHARWAATRHRSASRGPVERPGA